MHLSKSVYFWGPVCGIIIFLQHVGCVPVPESEAQCELPKGAKGTCKNIAICPAALSSLRSGVRDIVKCSGTDPKLICCSITPRPSAQKCAEYMNILKSNSKGPVPLLPPGFFDDEPEEIQCSLNLNPLISGGRPAEVGEFPHVAALAYDVPRIPWRCGGTLISDEFLLTAGHCVNNPTAGPPLRVLLGDVTLSKSTSETREIIDVDTIIVHPLYHPPETYHDLALIKLARKVKLSRSILPACLVQPEDDFLKGVENRTLNVAGWGVLGTGEAQSDTLQVAGLSGYSLKSCNALYNDAPAKDLKFPVGIARSQICAGDKVGRKDTCKGDSGAPLWATKTERCVFYLLGITSFGPSQCGSFTPGIYTNIYSYLDWIEQNVWPEKS